MINSLDRSVWRCRYLYRITNIRLCRPLVLTFFLSGSEAWSVGAQKRPFWILLLLRLFAESWVIIGTTFSPIIELSVRLGYPRWLTWYYNAHCGYLVRWRGSRTRLCKQGYLWKDQSGLKKTQRETPITWMHRIDGHWWELGLTEITHTWNTSGRDLYGWCRILATEMYCYGVCPH